MRFELSRGNVKLGFLTFLDGLSKPPTFTQKKEGEFDLAEIRDDEERAKLNRLIDESSEVSSGTPPARRVGEGEEAEPPPERTYKRGEDREWFEAFLKKLRGLGYVPKRVED
jgi:hypothetical protein